MSIAQELLYDINKDPYLLKIIVVGDETLICGRKLSSIVPMESDTEKKDEKFGQA